MNICAAPLPGKVTELLVQPGMVVQQGDPMFTIEAYKVANIIRAEQMMTVNKVHVQVGDRVTYGQDMFAYGH